MKRNFLLILLGAVFLGIACFSGYQLYEIFSEYHAGRQAYDDLGQYVTVNTDTDPTDEPQDVEVDDTVWPEVDFAALQAESADVLGWIYLEGTEINYPIVQGEDNAYYLNRLYNGTPNGSGSIFMDYRNQRNFSDRNTILYGHSMKNGTMFTAIKRYKNQPYYDEHPVALVLTPEKNYKLEFFAGYVCNVEQNAWDIVFASDEQFEQWVASAKSKSTFASDVTPTADEVVVTLSTCTYEFENARYVLVGVLR